MDELKALLESFFISKEHNREVYYSIREHHKNFKDFLYKLGYQIILRSDFARLEKLPGTPEVFMGIGEFRSQEEYKLFMLLLMFLEDKGRDEQFLLSHITEFIAANSIGKVDFTKFQTRRSLVNVLRFAMENQLMLLCDGESDRFAMDENVQVLYDSTGFSRYFVRDFPLAIFSCSNYEDLKKLTLYNEELDKTTLKRNRVYRNLLLSPVVYNHGPEDEDYNYIKNFKNNMAEDFQTYLGWTLHVHKNMAMLIPGEKDKVRNIYPNREGICDVVLLFSNVIVKLVRAGKLKPDARENIHLDAGEFLSIIEDIKLYQGQGFTKELREITVPQLAQHLVAFMKTFAMCGSGEDDSVVVYPVVGKVVGMYPEDFQGEYKNEE